jgi:hypothetical protein
VPKGPAFTVAKFSGIDGRFNRNRPPETVTFPPGIVPPLSWSRPSVTVVPVQVRVTFAGTTNSPAPDFVSGPVPANVPVRVRVLPFVWKVPPPALRVIARFVVRSWVTCRPPPSKVRPFDVVPRLTLSVMRISPPFMATVPVKVLTPKSPRVPPPDLVSVVVPEKVETMPGIVRSKPFVSNVAVVMATFRVAAMVNDARFRKVPLPIDSGAFGFPRA